MPYMVECNSCGTRAFPAGFVAGDGSVVLPDELLRCATPKNEPPGSAEGTCCTVHESHEAHVEHVKATMNAECRPITITVLPGSVTMSMAAPAGQGA